MPGTVLTTEDIAASKIDKSMLLQKLYSNGRVVNKQIVVNDMKKNKEVSDDK